MAEPTSRFGLRASVIDRIHSVLRQFPAVRQARLYGSRAMGNYREGSDIDLTFTGEGLSLSILGQIDLALDDLMLPYSFDLSIYDAVEHAPLREHIDRVGVVFYQACGDCAAPSLKSMEPTR